MPDSFLKPDASRWRMRCPECTGPNQTLCFVFEDNRMPGDFAAMWLVPPGSVVADPVTYLYRCRVCGYECRLFARGE